MKSSKKISKEKGLFKWKIIFLLLIIEVTIENIKEEEEEEDFSFLPSLLIPLLEPPSLGKDQEEEVASQVNRHSFPFLLLPLPSPSPSFPFFPSFFNHLGIQINYLFLGLESLFGSFQTRGTLSLFSLLITFLFWK